MSEFGHAFLAPSGMNTGVHCTYFYHANRDNPQPDTLETMEGEAAHHLLELALNQFKQTGNKIVDLAQWENTPADNGVFITSEMIDHVSDSFEHITELVKNQCNFDTLEIEGKVQIPQVHPTDCWGTLDLGFYDEATRKITIRDFKYGFGLVDEYQNYQLFLYFLGMLVKYPQAEYFDLGICQPRPFHRLGNNRNWTGHISDFNGMFEKVKQAVHGIYNNPVTTSGNHCRYCPVNYRCDAFINSTMNAIDVTMPPNINELNNEQLGKLYSVVERAFNTVKHMRESAKNTIVAKMDEGERVPGVTMAQTMGNSKWSVPDKMAIDMCASIGIENAATTKVKTPIAIINSLGKNDSRREIIDGYLKRSTTTSLIFDDGREADRVFGNK